MHLLRFRKYDDPNYVMPASERDYSHNSRPRKFHVDPDWLRSEYHDKRRPVGELAAEIGCSDWTLNSLVAKFGIPRRDGREGCVRPSRRANFDLQRAIWLYEIDRKNCDDIGAEMGCHGTVIRRRLREAGVCIRHHNDTKRGAKSPHRPKVNERAVVREYLKDGAGVCSVAEKFGITPKLAATILDENKVGRKRLREVRETLRGEAHPSWKPELTAEDREHARPRQPNWRLKVFERDRFTCLACGDSKGGNLHAHHVEAHCENKEARWKVSNGATLCSTCHRAFHRRFGVRGFGRAELDIFIADRSADIAA
ncbi:MAG: HNH endonuclease [Mesorhizobium sp.]